MKLGGLNFRLCVLIHFAYNILTPSTGVMSLVQASSVACHTTVVKHRHSMNGNLHQQQQQSCSKSTAVQTYYLQWPFSTQTGICSSLHLLVEVTCFHTDWCFQQCLQHRAYFLVDYIKMS